jgi:hypothetical protein
MRDCVLIETEGVEPVIYEWGAVKWVANSDLAPGCEQSFALVHALPGKTNPEHRHTAGEEIVFMLQGECDVPLGDREFNMVRAQGIAYAVGRSSFGSNAKARISAFPDGLVKLVFRVLDKALLGRHILDGLPSQLVHIGQFVKHQGSTIDRFIDATFAAPTRSEAYNCAASNKLMRQARRAGPRTAVPALSRADERVA